MLIDDYTAFGDEIARPMWPVSITLFRDEKRGALSGLLSTRMITIHCWPGGSRAAARTRSHQAEALKRVACAANSGL
jgi:hypothetical protein